MGPGYDMPHIYISIYGRDLYRKDFVNMCGIVGYIGNKNATEILINGLNKLEYRGYDSAGISVLCGNEIKVCKKKGRLSNLVELLEKRPLDATLGIGHTRWATHGMPSSINSHPHTSMNGNISVVHNGIIENYEELRSELIDKGYRFASETDTEVIPHLIDLYYEGDIFCAVKKAVSRLLGSYALGIICSDFPDTLIAVRKDSPLIIGNGEGENFIASDIPAILSYTRDVYFLEDNELALITSDAVSFSDIDGNAIKKEIHRVTFSESAAQKGGYDHFMLKEIHEQPKAIEDTLRGRLADDLTLTIDELSESVIKGINKIYIVACGTAYHAGLVGKTAIEQLAKIPVSVELASEFRYNNPLIDEDTLVIAVSQSGETADTLAGVRLAKSMGAHIFAITNVVGSTLSRDADSTFYTYAGPEISVASTKAYTTQLVALYLFGIHFAECKGVKSKKELDIVKRELRDMSEEKIKKISKKICNETDLYYLGRGLDYAVAMEGSLKLKEISYIHSEAFAGGELKHGPIALIEDNTVVISISTNKDLCVKMDSNIKEIVTRGAYSVAFVNEDTKEAHKSCDEVIVMPSESSLLSPIASVVPLQLLAYYVAKNKGLDIDKPRNLAKSVTVE